VDKSDSFGTVNRIVTEFRYRTAGAGAARECLPSVGTSCPPFGRCPPNRIKLTQNTALPGMAARTVFSAMPAAPGDEGCAPTLEISPLVAW
jgi:hypothetical protein